MRGIIKGITEERLSVALDNTDDPMGRAAIESLIDNCEELNPWQPIETAPKGRPVLLYMDKGPISCRQWVGHADVNWPWPPTHWQELPEDPT